MFLVNNIDKWAQSYNYFVKEPKIKRYKICLKRYNFQNKFVSLHPMYTLREAYIKMLGEEPMQHWDGKIYCNETNAVLTFRANETHGYMAAYTFTLVLKGWLTINYNGQELTLYPDDIYTYSPGLPVTILSASDDYYGICLLADEHVTIESPAVHDLLHIAYAPIVQLHQLKVSLKHDDVQRLADKMLEIRDYLHSDHIYKEKILQMLYAVFLLDLQNAQEHAIPHRSVSRRVEEIFIGFLRLLPQHFAEHHDVGFYADALHISPVYLSRVVRQVSGRTVMDYVNQFLVMEAAFLLSTSKLSIVQIAERLHFSDLPSFSKFFARVKGVSSKAYRMQR